MYSGEHAVVTGAASNIGREIAVALAREGARVTLTDIDAERLGAAADQIMQAGGEVETVVADLSDRDGWRNVYDAVADRPIDMFVHSACPQRNEADIALDVSEETFDAMLYTNVRSGFLLAREFARNMRAAGTAGRILFVTSLHNYTPRNLPHYSASKAGMTMIMKELARQLGPDGIRANAIAPGAIPGGGFNTSGDRFKPKQKIPLQRMGTADDVAEAAIALLSNRFMKYVTGETLAVDGGLQLYSWIDPPTA